LQTWLNGKSALYTWRKQYVCTCCLCMLKPFPSLQSAFLSPAVLIQVLAPAAAQLAAQLSKGPLRASFSPLKLQYPHQMAGPSQGSEEQRPHLSLTSQVSFTCRPFRVILHPLMPVPDVHEVHVWSGQMSVQPDDAGTIAVVRRKSRKCAHPQLRGRTFRPHDTLAGAVSKSTPTASGHDCMEWSAAYSLDSSAVLQAALTRKPANSAADTCGNYLTLRPPQCT